MNASIGLLLLVTACGGFASTPPGVGTPSSALRPEDRVVLGDFSRVQAVASSFDRLYVVYPSSVGIWRQTLQRWEVPRAAPGQYALADVTSAVIDPLDESLWMGSSSGLIHYSPQLDRWEQLPIPGRVIALATDRADPGIPVWARTTSGWYAQPRVGPALPGRPPGTVVPAPTLEDAYRNIPQLQSMSGTLVIGPGMRPGRLTAAAPAPSGRGWFIGTSNRGLLLFDRAAIDPVRMSQGLMGDVVGALALAPGGVWVATDDAASNTPASLQFVASDLSEVVSLEGDRALGLGISAVRGIAVGDGALWLGSDRGVTRVPIDGDRIGRWDANRGLTDPRVIAVVRWRGQVAAGTLRGLVLIDESTGDAQSVIGGVADGVYALLPAGDTLWVGTSRGMRALLHGDSVLRIPEGWLRHPDANRTILGIGYVADTLMAMTSERLISRDPLSGAWTAGIPLSSQLGSLRAFFVHGSAVWVGGDRGAGLVVPNVGIVRSLLVGIDLPDRVTAIVAEARWLWIGTTRGLVRIALVGG